MELIVAIVMNRPLKTLFDLSFLHKVNVKYCKMVNPYLAPLAR